MGCIVVVAQIDSIVGLEILDSRASPTIECTVHLTDGSVGRAAVPSGASVGEREVIELRDVDDPHYGGRGVHQAIRVIETVIEPALKGEDPLDQFNIDQRLLELDGTSQKKTLGGNTVLSVSMAVARAAAVSIRQPFYRYLGGSESMILPMPMLNILNGGAHANNSLDIQEIMIVPVMAQSFSQALEISVNVYQALGVLLDQRGLMMHIGDEGGFAPDVSSNVQALQLVLKAIEQAGYRPGDEVCMALDIAASELYRDGQYQLKSEKKVFTQAEWIGQLSEWIQVYPIVSIEDAMDQNDWEGWQAITQTLGGSVQLVGDDVFTTQAAVVQRAIDMSVANAVLIKPNQVGTLTETLATIACAKQADYGLVISHRSGETEDTSIVDLSVAVGAGQIKTGAPCRERSLKYNQLLRIEADLGTSALFCTGQALYDLSSSV